MCPVKCGVLARTLLAAYVLAAALLPLTHHDVACHFKSPTHCTTCAVATSGEAAPWAMSADGLSMPDAGRAILQTAASCDSTPIGSSSGRSPPTLG
jgi:hypothetical protein